MTAAEQRHDSIGLRPSASGTYPLRHQLQPGFPPRELLRGGVPVPDASKQGTRPLIPGARRERWRSRALVCTSSLLAMDGVVAARGRRRLGTVNVGTPARCPSIYLTTTP